MIDNLVDFYLNKSSKGNTAAECIGARIRYGKISEEGCKSPAIRRFFNGAHSEFMFGPVDNKESFINIPKKGNGLMYVILFVLAVFLFCKLKK